MQKHLHGIALLMLIILIAVSILGVLALSTASSEYKIALRQAEYALGVQECTNQANAWLSDLQAPAEGTLTGQTAEKLFTDGNGRFLKASVVFGENGIEITEWVSYTEWNADRPIDNLFNPDK